MAATPVAGTTLYLLRHAESQPDPNIPEPDWPLSGRGRQQAQELIPLLASLGINAVWASPFARAIDTVRPFAGINGLEVSLHPDFRERKLPWVPAKDFRALIRRTWQDYSFAPPGGESSVACQARVRRAVEEVSRRDALKTLLAASHGNAIALYINSIDSEFGYDDWAAMRSPDMFRVLIRGGKHFWDKGWRFQTGA